MIHRKKNRPALQRRDILTVSLVSFFLSFFCIGNLFRSFSSTQFLVLVSLIAFYTAPFFSKHFFLWLFLRSFSTLLFFLVGLLLLLLSTTAFSYLRLLSLF